MKRFLCILLAAALLLSGCAVGGKYSRKYRQEQEENYKRQAQQYMDAGEYEKALEILEEAVEELGSEELEEMLALVRSMVKNTDAPQTQTEQAELVDLSGYAGNWYLRKETGVDHLDLQLTPTGETLEVVFVRVNGTGSRISEVVETLPLTAMAGGTLTLPFEDSWGNTGTMELSFARTDMVTVVIRDMTMDSGALWGVAEGTFTMVRRGSQVAMDSSTQFEINIFLSNFAEQAAFGGWEVSPGERFHVDEGDVAMMAHFIFLYYCINVQGHLTDVWDDPSYPGSMGAAYAKLSQLNKDMERFFGITVTERQLADAGLDVRGGKLYFPYEPDGPYQYLAAVPAMYSNGDGTYTVTLEVYSTTNGIDRNTYKKTAAQLRETRGMELVMTGEAVVRPYSQNGRNTYQLISYEIYE